MEWARGARLVAGVVVAASLSASSSFAQTQTQTQRKPAPAKTAAQQPQEVIRVRQATIAAMSVMQMPNGKLIGATLPLVATVGGDAPNGKVSIRGTIGPQMKTALDEAERFVRIDEPHLANASIEISFEDKYSPKDGGSAGAAMTVLMRSIFDGFQIDKHVAVTGDVAVNGNIQKIGGVSSKIRGAIADGYTVITLPKANAAAVADLFVTPERFNVLKSTQIFSVETIPDMIAIVRSDRNERLDQAITLYAQVQDGINAGMLGYLRKPETIAALKAILELAPNHISAKYALDLAQGKGPSSLTRTGSLVEIFSAAYPFAMVMKDVTDSKKKLTRDMLPTDTMKEMIKDLRAMRSQTHPDVEKLRTAMVDWIDAVDKILSARRGQIIQSDLVVIDRRAQNLEKELGRLGTDQTLIEKLMREGY